MSVNGNVPSVLASKLLISTPRLGCYSLCLHWTTHKIPAFCLLGIVIIRKCGITVSKRQIV